MADSERFVSRLTRTAASLTLLALLTFAFAGANAKGLLGGDDDEDESAKKPPPEWAVALPAFPKPENFLPFSAGPIATQQFAIDSKSLAVGPNEVRYTLITTSSSGARNVSYEGIRCSSFEVNRYAFGHGDGKWTQARSDKWVPIQFYSANRPQAALAQDFFCLGQTIEGKPEQMLDRIRYNRSLLDRTYKAS